jgi:uncharacterized membrane protein YphA (DoxX/SURF4 family)
LLARLVLGTMWIIAGWAKLFSKMRLRESVSTLGVAPRRAAHTVVIVLPWVELLLGGLLMLGLWTVPAARASIGLLLIFSVAIAVNLLRGNRVECSCFGQLGRKPISWRSLARNAVLLAVAALVDFYQLGYFAVDAWRDGSVSQWADTPIWDFTPVLLMLLGAGLLFELGRSAWRAGIRPLRTLLAGFSPADER